MSKTIAQARLQAQRTPEGMYIMEIKSFKDVNIQVPSKATVEDIKNDTVPTVTKSVLTGELDTGKIILIYSDKTPSKVIAQELPSFHENLLTHIYMQLCPKPTDNLGGKEDTLDMNDTESWEKLLVGKKVTVYCTYYEDKETGAIYENYYVDSTDKRVKAMLKEQELIRKASKA